MKQYQQDQCLVMVQGIRKVIYNHHRQLSTLKSHYCNGQDPTCALLCFMIVLVVQPYILD